MSNAILSSLFSIIVFLYTPMTSHKTSLVPSPTPSAYQDNEEEEDEEEEEKPKEKKKLTGR